MSPRSNVWRCAMLMAAVVAASCTSLSSAALAHPHVWATVRSEIVLDANGHLVAVKHAWTFDEFYTAMAVQGLDKDGDGKFSEEELKPLAQVNIESLRDFDYFTFIHIGEDGDNLPLDPPKDYSLDYDKNLLTLHFTMPLKTPLDLRGQTAWVDVYDPSFFVAFGFATEAPVKLSGDVKGCSAELKKPDAESAEDAKALSEAFFSQLGPNSNFGSQFAQTVLVKCGNAPS